MVSVLVSCYNVEKFLEKGIKSIVEQTYKNCEFIFVDDGSTDNTLSILKEWEQKDNRIKVIKHKYNQGLGAARNTGLEHANGDFICFIDVDDYPHPNLVETCIKEIEAKDAEMMIFGFNGIEANKPNFKDRVEYKEHLVTSTEELKDIYVDSILLARYGEGFAWNKFYKRSFIEKHNLRFGTQKIQQDEPFALQAISKVERLYLSSSVLYDYYLYNSGNNRSRYIEDRIEIYLDIDSRLRQFLQDLEIDDKRATEFIDNRMWMGLLTFLNYDLKHKDCNLSKIEKKNRINKLLDDKRISDVLERKCLSTDFRTKTKAYALLNNKLRKYYLFCNFEEFTRRLVKIVR